MTCTTSCEMRLVHASCVDMTLRAAPMLCTEAVHAAASPMTTKKWVECTACQAGLATMLDLMLHFILQEASLGRDEQHLASQSQLVMQGCQGISSRPLPPTSTVVACSVNDIPAPVSNDSKHDPSAYRCCPPLWCSLVCHVEDLLPVLLCMLGLCRDMLLGGS